MTLAHFREAPRLQRANSSMHFRAAVIRAIGCAFLLGRVVVALSLGAEEPKSDSPFVTGQTVREFLRLARARMGGLARVQGTVTYQASNSIVIQDNTAGVLIETSAAKPLDRGTRVEAIGTITRGLSAPMIGNATIRVLGHEPPVQPIATTAKEIMSRAENFQLIRVAGRYQGRDQRGNRVFLRLRSEGIHFEGELHYTLPGDPFAYIAPGSLLELTGVCSEQRSAPGALRIFEVLLRSPQDVVVVQGPSWWTAQRAVLIASSVVLLVLVVAAWAGAVSRGIDRQAERIRQEIQREARHSYANLEERIQERTAQLQVANRELEAFAYTISHDLRAPLRAVEGFATLVQNELPPDQQSPEVKHALEVIRGSALRMSQLIEDLLEFARLGRIEATPTEVNLESLVWSVYEELKVQIGSRTMEFEVGRLPPVLADGGMIRQLVGNLLSNAIKYTRPRDVAKIEFGSFEQEAETVYFIRDNGVGFDMRYASKLFGVFHRLHADKRFEGTGVGLAIVHRILERHHGRIWAESELDRGTTFYFTIGRPTVQNLNGESAEPTAANSAELEPVGSIPKSHTP